MGSNNLLFLENLEWFDETGQELVHRLPEEGSGEIKYGAQLTLRESQAGVFYYKGKQYTLGDEKSAQSRSILCKFKGFHQSEMGHPGSGGLQRF